jgi:ankyrin repeat protein
MKRVHWYHAAWIAQLLTLFVLLLTEQAAEARRGLPSAKDVERASNRGFVLAQFTPLLDMEAEYTATLRASASGREHRMRIEVMRLPSGWEPSSSLEKMLVPYGRAALLFVALDPGEYVLESCSMRLGKDELRVGAGGNLLETRRTQEFEPDLDRRLVVEAGKVLYAGAFAFEKSQEWVWSDADWLLAEGRLQPGNVSQSSSARQLLFEDLPVALATLAVSDSALPEVVKGRVVRATYLDDPAVIAGQREFLFFEAATKGDAEALRQLLVENVDVHAVDAADYEGTALHKAAAAWGTGTPAVELLLAAGADPLAADKRGDTPLHLAAGGSTSDVVESLLAHGASVNAQNLAGEIPLHRVRAEQVVRALVAHGAAVNARDRAGRTPLHHAVKTAGYRSADQEARAAGAVRELLSSGADVNAADRDGFTALHFAAEDGHQGLAELLLAGGADVNAKTKAGEMPLGLSQQQKHSEVAALLRSRGAQ